MTKTIETTKTKKQLAIRGALILGGIVVASIAINVILELDRHNVELNRLRDDVESLKETANEAIAFMRP